MWQMFCGPVHHSAFVSSVRMVAPKIGRYARARTTTCRVINTFLTVWRLSRTRVLRTRPVYHSLRSHRHVIPTRQYSPFMDTTLSSLPVFSDEFTLSQLPFFSEGSVYDPLSPPHTPPSVCKACWKGPFARYLGLLSVSETGDRWYPPWSKKNSYSTSLTKLQSRADAGCVWCRFLLNEMRNWIYLGERLIITLRRVAAKWCNVESSWDHSAQALMVDINGVHGFYHDIISTTLGGSGKHQVFLSQPLYTELTIIIR